MDTIASRLKKALAVRKMRQSELASLTGIGKSSISTYLSGAYNPKQGNIHKMAKALEVNEAWLMGVDVPMERNYYSPAASIPPGFEPVHMVRKPLLGSIACGEPILAQENIEDLLDVPADIPCDFLLRCKGDSMIGARIQDGDIVYIRQQDDVENGQIAAVLIGDTATLKRVYKAPGQLILQAENPAYPPMVHTAAGAETVRIIGLAVGFLSKVK